ncbi:helix-turn-helix domain-containing protein [Fibrisoma montanum]|uniref:Helix-turn-helix domain-containing protein n=1 Tax=Fibrisoma montanum TaxID=2305895 RepID=A0A418M260_9BACT|nr:helix-turn-helix domain-containing protein [Fibrisoma montanum]RIV19801.1 helix-turn-helix domain-containing protein [Fibrisoma montanum]
MKIFWTIVFLWSFLVLTCQAQIRVEVTNYPNLSSAGKGLYIAGEFNNWDPGDPDFKLQKQANGLYAISLPDSLTHFEYKFTQGSWALAEGDSDGGKTPNRVYDRARLSKTPGTNPKLIRTTIAGWEQRPYYRFVVTELPANTPHDAQLFITGDFTNWNPGNPAYRLQKQPDGTYTVTVYSDADRLEYKFTRGNWESVEGREVGKARPNRIVYRRDILNDQPVDVHIISWEDLTGTFNFYSIYDLLMLFSCFQGLLLLIAIPTIHNYNWQANRRLVLLLGITSVLMGIRVISGFRDVAQAYTKLLLVPDFIWFIYAPLFYFYIRKLLFNQDRMARGWQYHYLPAAIQLLAYLPYFLMESKVFQLKVVNRAWDLQALFIGFGFLALLFNIRYWIMCRKLIRAYKDQYQTSYSYEQNLQYLSSVLTIQAICLTLWAFMYVIVGFSRIVDFDVLSIAERNVDAIWLVFSTITYFLGYYAIHQPEVFKLPEPLPVGLFEQPEPLPVVPAPVQPVAERIDKPGPAPLAPPEPVPDEDIQPLKEQVEAYMKRHKPYTNPNLTIHELATKLKLQPHVLSRVINDGFEKNFFDFINYYRVEELKKRMDDPRFRNYTLLSLAFEVGFNSKTAFNRAFKKITQQTPSDYFNYVRE